MVEPYNALLYDFNEKVDYYMKEARDRQYVKCATFYIYILKSEKIRI